MLSFDITDRNIRIIKGAESGGKIKISKAATLNLEEEVIINGHVKDIPRVATLINGILKKSGMADKEAIVSISSNLTIFKELQVPRAKEQEFAKRVRQEMLSSLNIDDSYSVSYVIVGGAEDKGQNGEVMVKVLATACPFEVVECYKKVFQMLGISLKSVMVGCNCITKVLLSDTKIRAKMPLLAVQIDPNFISLNIYEKGQLSFSRFATIDPADYGNSNDYVFEAVNENIFRMLQFHKSRNLGEQIENVVFYGDTSEFNRLTDELGKMDLNTSIIQVPPQIYGYQNLEFSLYANAIGALFKRNKENEKINLLQSDGINSNKIKSDSSYTAILAGVLIGSIVLVGGAFTGLLLYNNSIRNDISETVAKINSKDTKDKLVLVDRLEAMKVKVDNYLVRIDNAHDAFESQPTILGDTYDKIEEIIDKTAEECEIERAVLKKPKYESGIIDFSIECDGVLEPSQKFPAKLAENLLKYEEFAHVTYNDYTVKATEDAVVTENNVAVITDEKQLNVEFDMKITLKGHTIYNAEDEKEAK